MENDRTCAGKSITGVSIITGTVETVQKVGTSGKFTASSIVLSAFIHICVMNISRDLYNTTDTDQTVLAEIPVGGRNEESHNVTVVREEVKAAYRD